MTYPIVTQIRFRWRNPRWKISDRSTLTQRINFMGRNDDDIK